MSQPNVTEDAPQSHVDLDDVQAALKTGMVSAHEARIALALRLDSGLSGLRALERASGLCRKTILKVLPYRSTGSTTLLRRTEVGRFAWDPEDRSSMALEYRSFVHHSNPSKTTNPLMGQEPLKTLKGSEEHEGVLGARMTGVLDPSRDLWANTDEGLGDHGWVLAMVTGLKAATFTLDELAGLLRLGARQIRRILDRLEKLSWVQRVKEGRRALVTVDFSLLVKADEDEVAEQFLQTRRRDQKAVQHMHEAESVAEMGTEDGRRIREMWKNRREEARRIRRLLAAVPEGMRYRADRLLRALDAVDGTRWWGEHTIRMALKTS